jgi:hypothetical protein
MSAEYHAATRRIDQAFEALRADPADSALLVVQYLMV